MFPAVVNEACDAEEGLGRARTAGPARPRTSPPKTRRIKTRSRRPAVTAPRAPHCRLFLALIGHQGLSRWCYRESLPEGKPPPGIPHSRGTSRKCNASAAAGVTRESNNPVRALIPPPGTDGNYFGSTVNLRPFTWAVTAAVAAVVALALTGCGGSPAATAAEDSPTPGPYAGNPDSGDCLLGANGADVEAGIADPTVACSRWIQNLAGNGLVWYPISQMVAPGSAGTADGETMQEACDLTDGTQELYVEDAGGQMYGDSICSQEEQNGWTPEGSPGPLAAQAQQAAQQQAQASTSAAAAQASANAAAAQAQQVSQAQNSLQNDISTLGSDANTLNTDNSLASGVQEMKSDLGQQQADYQTEQSDGCPSAGGDADTVGGDADTVGGDLDTLNGDIETLQAGEFAAVKTDIANLNNDLASLQNLGASPDVSASAAIASGNQALKNANSAIAWAQGQGQQINSEAQALATTAQNWASQHGC
jgi:chemotaxis protein histidine kinase CheA